MRMEQCHVDAALAFCARRKLDPATWVPIFQAEFDHHDFWTCYLQLQLDLALHLYNKNELLDPPKPSVYQAAFVRSLGGIVVPDQLKMLAAIPPGLFITDTRFFREGLSRIVKSQPHAHTLDEFIVMKFTNASNTVRTGPEWMWALAAKYSIHMNDRGDFIQDCFTRWHRDNFFGKYSPWRAQFNTHVEGAFSRNYFTHQANTKKRHHVQFSQVNHVEDEEGDGVDFFADTGTAVSEEVATNLSITDFVAGFAATLSEYAVAATPTTEDVFSPRRIFELLAQHWTSAEIQNHFQLPPDTVERVVNGVLASFLQEARRSDLFEGMLEELDIDGAGRVIRTTPSNRHQVVARR